MSPNDHRATELTNMCLVLGDIADLVVAELSETAADLLDAALAETRDALRCWRGETAMECSVCGNTFACEPAAISGCRARDELVCEPCYQLELADFDDLEAVTAAPAWPLAVVAALVAR